MQRQEKIDYKWDIQYIDIDPDSGDTSDPKSVATTKCPIYANIILDAFINQDENPNRHYFIVKCISHSIKETQSEHAKWFDNHQPSWDIGTR
jgi:hypothetical protein